MILTLLRHGKTAGNLQRRYIGITDESLCDEGKKELLEKSIIATPAVLYSSPMKRCLETAALLLPEVEPVVVPALRECDFGAFEGKNYEELKDDPSYQRFLDTKGEEVPGGESTKAFRQRCCQGFLEIIAEMQQQEFPDGVMICHGGTIMAIMERFDVEAHSFYDYQVPNGGGYRVQWNPQRRQLRILEQL